MQTFTLKPLKPLQNTMKVYQSPVVYKQSNLLLAAEYVRRNDIIKKLASEFPFKVGDRVVSSLNTDKNVYVIKGIDKDWSAYKGQEVDEYKVEWPKNDNPKIVWAFDEKTNEPITATTNYFKCLAK